MKMRVIKYIVFLIIFLIPTIGYCDRSGYSIIARKIAALDSGCDGTQTFVGDPGDTETFEFEEADFCTTEFSEVDPDTIISTYSTTQFKNGSHSAFLGFTGTADQNDNYISINTGGTDGDFTYSFWIWVEDKDDFNTGYIGAVNDGSASCSTPGFYMTNEHYETGLWRLHGIGVLDPLSSDGSSSLPTETWLRIEIDYNQNATTTIEIYNTSEELQDTLSFTANDVAIQYFFFGECVSSETTFSYYIDDVRYKSSGGGF